MSTTEIKEVELSIEHAKEMVARRDAVRRLESNRDFKKLILEGLFKEEASRLVALYGDPSVREHRSDITESMLAISGLRAYFRQTIQMGDMAARELSDLEEALEETRNAELTEG